MTKEYLFAYGMFRETARTLLGDFVNCGMSTINGKLYRVNDFYPGYKKDDKSKVYGNVYAINEERLKELDEFEGSEYTRKKVVTSNDIECWVYEYNQPVRNDQLIKGGDWLLR